MDHDLLEEIINQHLNLIYRIAIQNVKNEADVQDICQEVLIKLMKQKNFENE